MKNQRFYNDQNQKPAGVARPAAGGELRQNKIAFVPAVHEVAGRAYASYLNGGSQHGHHMQHWLEAEAQLHAEHDHSEQRPPPITHTQAGV